MKKKKKEKHLRRFPSTAGAGRVAEESASGETTFRTEGRKEERRKERERESAACGTGSWIRLVQRTGIRQVPDTSGANDPLNNE